MARCEAVEAIGQVRIGARLEHDTDVIGVATHAGQYQRRGPILVGVVDVGPARQQRTYGFHLAAAGRGAQGRAAIVLAVRQARTRHQRQSQGEDRSDAEAWNGIGTWVHVLTNRF